LISVVVGKILPKSILKPVQKLYLKILGVIITGHVPSKEKSRHENCIYVSNTVSTVDKFLLGVFYEKVYIDEAVSKNFPKFIQSAMNWTESPENGSCFQIDGIENTGVAVLNWVDNGAFSSVFQENRPIKPIFIKTSSFFPLETSTIYSTHLYDALCMLFQPYTIYRIHGREAPIYRNGETVRDFIKMVRGLQAFIGNVPLSPVSVIDKQDLLKRYSFDAKQAEIDFRRNPKNSMAPKQPSNSESVAQSKPKAKAPPQTVKYLASIFPTVDTSELHEAMLRNKNVFKLAVQELFAIEDSLGKTDSERKLTENPVKKEMDLEERKHVLVLHATANFVKKHGIP